MRYPLRQIISSVCLLVVAVTAVGYLSFQSWADRGLEHSSVLFEVKSGDSLKAIADDLVKQGILDDPLLFKTLVRIESLQTQLKAGEYQFRSPISARQLLAKLSAGEVKLFPVRLREGVTALTLLKDLKQVPYIQHTLGEFTTNSQIHEQLAKKLGLSIASAEGFFFPDTYLVRRGITDVDLLKRAYLIMQDKLSEVWTKRRSLASASEFALQSREQLLILASIIEKETGLNADRGKISQVFHRRLAMNMRLQTDPTVIYALDQSFDGDIRRKDLRLDSPYNTYRYGGLPPTPIALPSYQSLLAAAQPSNGEFLYFVAKGNGRSQFSKTLAQHNAAVRRYQLDK